MLSKTTFRRVGGIALAAVMAVSGFMATKPRHKFGATPGVISASTAIVGGSGQSLLLNFQDTVGNPTSVSSVQTGNDTQVISVKSGVIPGTTVNGTFTLSFVDSSGTSQTTGAINYTVGNPTTGGMFTFPTTVGRTYRIGSYWVKQNFFNTQVLAEVINESGQIVASHAQDQVNTSPGSFTAPAPGGAAFPWDTIVSGYVATGTTLSVRITGLGSNQLAIDAIMVQDTTATTNTAYDSSDATHFTTYGTATTTTNASWVGGSYLKWQPATGLGGTYRCLPADVVNALSLLPNILPQSIIVTASDGTSLMPLTVLFGGSMGGTAQNLMTTSSPYLAVGGHVLGGQVPTITVNGGSAIPVKDWAAVKDQGIVVAPAAGLLHQASPLVQTAKTRAGNFSSTGTWAKSIVAGTVSDAVYSSSTAGAICYFPFQGQPLGTYQVGITYPATGANSTNSQFQVQDATGNVLGTYTVDQTVTPTDYTDGLHAYKILDTLLIGGTNSGLTIVAKTAGTTGQIIIDAVQLKRTSSDTSIQIAPSDTVTLSAPDGFFVTASGSVPAFSGLSLANFSGGTTLPSIPTIPKTLSVGGNVSNTAYFDDGLIFSNMAAKVGTPTTNGLADANQYPTLMTTATITGYPITEPETDVAAQGNGKASFNCPVGKFVLRWDGGVNMTLSGSNGTTITEDPSLRIYNPAPGSTGQQRVYSITMPPNGLYYAPTVNFNLTTTIANTDPSTSGTYPWVSDLTNFRVYPPNPADPSGNTAWGLGSEVPPKFHPSWMYKIASMKALRFMDAMRTNQIPYKDVADIRLDTAVFRDGNVRTAKVNITKCEPYLTPLYYEPRFAQIKVTTATPHNLYSGLVCNFSGAGTGTFSDGVSRSLTTFGLVTVLDATTLVWKFPTQLTAGTVMTNTTTGGSLSSAIGSGFSLADCVDLCNANNSDAWFNVPITISDATVDYVADYFAAHLNAGLKVHVEYGNETWNYLFQGTSYLDALNYQLNGLLTYNVDIYTRNAVNVHNRWAARYALAGRPSTDLIRTFCGVQTDTVRTKNICNGVTANGGTMDEFANGVYWNNAQTWPSNLYANENQSLDILEATVINHGPYMGSIINGVVKLQRDTLNANGFPSAILSCYEMSPEAILPGSEYGPPGTVTGPYVNSTPVTANLFYRQQAVRRHPRFYQIYLAMLQRLNDEGVTLANQYYVMGEWKQFAWSTYEWQDQLRGTGNPITDALNISDPQNTGPLGVKSTIGGAIYYWNSLNTPTPPPTPTPIPGPTVRPGRDGDLRRPGRNGGTFRP